MYSMVTLIIKAGVATVIAKHISEQISYQDKEEHYIIITESILHKDTTIFNIYTTNKRESLCMQ